MDKKHQFISRAAAYRHYANNYIETCPADIERRVGFISVEVPKMVLGSAGKNRRDGTEGNVPSLPEHLVKQGRHIIFRVNQGQGITACGQREARERPEDSLGTHLILRAIMGMFEDLEGNG